MIQTKRLWTLLMALTLLMVAAAPALAQQPPGAQISAGGGTPEAGWSSFFYFFAPGAAFRPRDSDVTWNYDGAGCISMPSGDDWFTLHLDLPRYARIDYLRLFFYDSNSTYASTALIVRYDGEGNFDEYAVVSSSGSGGYGTNLSSYFGGTMDTLNYGYAVLWKPEANGNTLRLCGVRVAYRLALDEVFLPLVVKD